MIAGRVLYSSFSQKFKLVSCGFCLVIAIYDHATFATFVEYSNVMYPSNLCCVLNPIGKQHHCRIGWLLIARLTSTSGDGLYTVLHAKT